MADWRDGDVLLFRDATRTAVGTVITAVMTLRYGSGAARWTHAAIYAGHGMIIEAVASDPRVVQEVPISRYIPSRVIERRAIPILTDVERQDIIIAARATVGRKYNYPRAIQAGLAGLNLSLPAGTTITSDATLHACICSDVVIDAYLVGANVALAPAVRGVPSPAALSVDTRLVRQPVTMCQIGDSHPSSSAARRC